MTAARPASAAAAATAAGAVAGAAPLVSPGWYFGGVVPICCVLVKPMAGCACVWVCGVLDLGRAAHVESAGRNHTDDRRSGAHGYVSSICMRSTN